MGDIQTVLARWGVWAIGKALEFIIIRHYVYG